jgi:hypothetical protein
VTFDESRYGGRYIAGGGGGGGGEEGAAPTLADQYPSALTTDLVDTGTSTRTGITVTASATPHSPGSWVQADASLAADVVAMVIHPSNGTSASAADSSCLLEVGTGAAAAETSVATILFGFRFVSSMPIVLPISIAAGTRVALRLQSAIVSHSISTIYVHFINATGKAVTPGAPVMMGIDTLTSRGTAVTAPGSNNTKGAWTQIAASTAAEFEALVVCAQGNGGTSMAGGGVLLDIGIGAAAAETVLFPDIWLQGGSSENYNWGTVSTFGKVIPVGSRLSARYARSSGSNALDVALLGIPAA